MLQRITNKWWNLVAERKYRFVDDDLCCCGCTIGKGGDICAHGGCRSAKEYAITCFVENKEKSNART